MINNVEPVKHLWCQKILPMVYDDSLSYYEAICKLVAKINEIIAFINDNIKGIIDKYFNNVMVDAIYDEEGETIILKKELLVGDGVHVYSASDNSMTIREE